MRRANRTNGQKPFQRVRPKRGRAGRSSGRGVRPSALCREHARGTRSGHGHPGSPSKDRAVGGLLRPRSACRRAVSTRAAASFRLGGRRSAARVQPIQRPGCGPAAGAHAPSRAARCGRNASACRSRSSRSGEVAHLDHAQALVDRSFQRFVHLGDLVVAGAQLLGRAGVQGDDRSTRRDVRRRGARR